MFFCHSMAIIEMTFLKCFIRLAKNPFYMWFMLFRAIICLPNVCIVIRVVHSLLQGQGSFHEEATLGTPVTPLTPATPATPDPPPAPVAREKSNSADVVRLGVFKL